MQRHPLWGRGCPMGKWVWDGWGSFPSWLAVAANTTANKILLPQ